MTEIEFNQCVQKYGKDILRFCRLTTGNVIDGDELYQDTMLKLFEQKEKLNIAGNIKSYALSVSSFIWKNRQRKFAWRRKIVPTESYEVHIENGENISLENETVETPEQYVLKAETVNMVKTVVKELPEKYRNIIYMYYAADMKTKDIAICLNISENTVKSRLRKAKERIKKRLEAIGYER